MYETAKAVVVYNGAEFAEYDEDDNNNSNNMPLRPSRSHID